MLFFKKISVIIITIFVALLIIDRFYQSEVNEILIKDVVINAKENIRYLNFKQEINIDSPIRKAINNGIPLVFKVILKIVKINDILPNKTVSKEIRYYQIEYKALRKVYKISLNSYDLLLKPYYNINNNDIIIIHPNFSKVKSAGFIGSPSSIASISSLLLSITLLLINN